MKTRSVLTAGALAIGLVLGVVAAPAVRAGIASAQSQPQTQPQGKAGNYRNIFLDKLAAALNIQRPTLDQGLKTAAGGTIDQAVKDGKLTQQQADQAKARVAQGQFWGFWGGHGKRGAQFGQFRKTMVEAAAKELKLTPAQLQAELRGGKTIAQIAAAQHTTEAAVTKAVLDAAKAQLTQAVTDGKLTQQQADAIYARMEKAGPRLLHGVNRRQGAPNRGSKQAAPAQGTSQS